MSRLSIIPIKLFEADHKTKMIENEINAREPRYISFIQFIKVCPITPGITSLIIDISMSFERGVYLIRVEIRIIIGKMDMNKKNADCAE